MFVGALSDIRILDLSRLLPGPYCSMMLADLGAEVIKVEEPGIGDYIRAFPPKLNKESAIFLSLNRNKKSITLDLKKHRGRDIFLDLVKDADVVIEGFRPGVIDKIGIGYSNLKEKNPRIILCSISGYGQEGPYAKKAGHDLNFLSIAGMTRLTGTKEGKPIIPGVQIGDIGGGSMLAAICILTAIIAREKTGTGQYIDVSMLDGSLAWLSAYIGQYLVDAKELKPSGEMLTGQFACYNVYKTKDDRYMVLGAVEPQFWSAFCKAIKREDFIKDQYTTGERAKELIVEIEKIFLENKKTEWIDFFKDIDCCCEPVNNFSEAISNPQLLSRNMFIEIDHPTEGTIRQVNFPGKLSNTPATMRLAPPALGQHNEEILRTLGLTKQEIVQLANEKVI